MEEDRPRVVGHDHDVALEPSILEEPEFAHDGDERHELGEEAAALACLVLVTVGLAELRPPMMDVNHRPTFTCRQVRLLRVVPWRRTRLRPL